MTPRIRTALILLALAFAGAACAENPEVLVERTLDAREKTMADGDMEGYIALFHPDYQYQEGATETIRSSAAKRFSQNRSIRLVTSNRRITFEHDRLIARVVQEFTIFAQTNDGRQVRYSGTEHFLLKKYRRWFLFPEYLFYEGLGV